MTDGAAVGSNVLVAAHVVDHEHDEVAADAVSDGSGEQRPSGDRRCRLEAVIPAPR